MTALKRREKPLKEKRYLYYIYTCTYVIALTTLTTMTTMTTLEIKLSTKIRKRHIYFCYFFAVPSFARLRALLEELGIRNSSLSFLD